MTGLGIVLEETDSPVILRKGFQDSDLSVESEALLPPLLHELDAPGKPLPLLGLGGAAVLLPPSLVSPSEGGLHPIDSGASEVNPELQSLVVPTGFTSECSEIEFDSKLLAFPTIEPPTPALATFLSLLTSLSAQPPQQAGSTTSSPLSRLKSLKKGIRKLSLSRMSSSMSLSASSPALPIELVSLSARPSMSPVQAEFHHEVSSQSSHCDSSPMSSYSGLGMRNASCSCPPLYTKQGNCVDCIHQGHAANMPQSAISLGKVRRRTLSQSNWTSNGAPLPLPIITLSDNLPSSSENLSSVDQSFFGTFSRSPLSTNTFSGESALHSSEDIGGALSKLKTPEDLIDYLIYLSEHKKSVEDAFAVAKDRLLSSGWCSRHDFENLNLQRDVSLSQIDTKLLQIEEKLNSEFQVSMLNNIDVQSKQNASKPETVREPLSPSLKVLEKKFILFSLEQQALRSN